MNTSIELTKVYDAPLEKVWQALTDPDALSEWLMPCDFMPKVGHKFQFRTESYLGFNGITNCEVLQVKEQELISFSWSGGPLKNTIVTFKLTAQGTKTRLDFEHTGFKGLVNTLVVRKILSNGWKNKILTVQLPKYLSK